MTRRHEINELLKLGALPESNRANEEQITRTTELLLSIAPPVTREEGIALMQLFGPDECFGLAWTLIHLIESAPGGAPVDALDENAFDNEWIRLLRERALRGNSGCSES